MRFFSKYRPARYIVEPRRYEVLANGQKQLRDDVGIAADFTPAPGGSIFDSVEAQGKLHWSDDVRERVENHLRTHPDFGHGLYLADADPGVPSPGSDSCKVMIPVAGGVRLCARTTDGSDICTEHAQLLSAGEVPEVDLPPIADLVADDEELAEAVSTDAA